MSRYFLQSKNEKHRVVVGWDNPLQTYFIQVEDMSQEEESEAMLVWEGGMPGEITDIEKLKKSVEPYGTLSEYVYKQLQLDYSNRTKPSRLQSHFAQKLRELEVSDG